MFSPSAAVYRQFHILKARDEDEGEAVVILGHLVSNPWNTKIGGWEGKEEETIDKPTVEKKEKEKEFEAGTRWSVLALKILTIFKG